MLSKNYPHRVVNRKGEMAPDHIFESRDFQRMLLEDEGITFKSNGCIDLTMHLWEIDVEEGNQKNRNVRNRSD